MKRDRLRALSREFGDHTVIEVTQGLKTYSAIQMPEEHKKEIRVLFCQIFEVPDMKDVPIKEMYETLQPEQLLERFAYRKRNAALKKEFL